MYSLFISTLLFDCHLQLLLRSSSFHQTLLFTKSRGTAASIRAESIATDGDNMAAFSASNKKDLNSNTAFRAASRPPGRLLCDALAQAETRHREEFPGALRQTRGL
jgi:hypothetical protein